MAVADNAGLPNAACASVAENSQCRRIVDPNEKYKSETVVAVYMSETMLAGILVTSSLEYSQTGVKSR